MECNNIGVEWQTHRFLHRENVINGLKIFCGIFVADIYVFFMQTFPHLNFVKTLILALIFPSMILLFDVLVSLGAHVTIAVYILHQALTTPGYSYHFPTLDASDLVVIVAVSFAYILGLYLHLGRRKNENDPNYYIPSSSRVNNLEYIRATSV